MPYQIELDVSLVKMFALLIFKNLWKHKIYVTYGYEVQTLGSSILIGGGNNPS